LYAFARKCFLEITGAYSMRYTAFLLLVVLSVARPLISSADTQTSPNLDQLIDSVRSEMKPEQAMAFMQRVYATDRFFTYPKFQETAQFLQQTMQEIGLKDVEL